MHGLYTCGGTCGCAIGLGEGSVPCQFGTQPEPLAWLPRHGESTVRAPLCARAGVEQTIGAVQRGLVFPNERVSRSERRTLGLRPQMKPERKGCNQVSLGLQPQMQGRSEV